MGIGLVRTRIHLNINIRDFEKDIFNHFNLPRLFGVGDFAQRLSLGGAFTRARDFRIFEVVDDEIFVDSRHDD